MNDDRLTDGGELCARSLALAGVRDVFVLHGGHLDPIFQACIDEGIRLVDMRHEAAAGHAADAYARQTGRLAVCMATAGPGFTNAITALAQATLDRTPLVMIIGAPPLRDVERWPLQGGIDQIAMARPVTKWAMQATRTELIPFLLAQAFREAVSGAPGPVLLEIPIDVLYSRVAAAEIAYPAFSAEPPRPAPAPDCLARVLAALRSARRPAILCGGGMLYARAAADLRAFSERAGIPVYANNKARGVLPSDHPLCAGAHTNMAVAQASGLGAPDVVLVLGARFGMFTEPGLLGPGHVPPLDARILQVDVSSVELGRVRPVETGVVADCGEFLRALDRAAGDAPWPDWSAWSGAVHALQGWHRSGYDEAANASGRIHPYRAVAAVLQALGDDTIVCADGGEASAWAEMLSRPATPGSLMSHGYLGCLGIGLPFAIGAQVANPGRRVAVITGDGSLGFHLQEFDTMVRHDLPIVTVVLNNKAWGMCVHGQQAMYGANRLVATQLGDARYDRTAAGLGCHGEYVDSEQDIAAAIARALASGRPACVEILTDIDASPLGGARKPADAAAPRESGEIALPYYERIKT
jgi:acetolactate synthase-1/2/3 large subunit